MKRRFEPKAKKLNKNRKRRQLWQQVVRGMAMVVVFCTTYALILPAITMQSDAVCGLEPHTHTEECYEVHPVTGLICTVPEDETLLHQHTDACYVQSECTEEHEHSEECTGQPVLACGMEEIPVHVHGDACYGETGETEQVLICGLQEHVHTDSCYPEKSDAPVGMEYHCGYAAHFHGEGCTDAEGTLVCSIPEHAHTAACAVEEVDLTADIESASDWEKLTERLALTGDWQTDLLAVADSQLGYRESEKNVVLVAEQLNGYTRYGDWYGNPYWEWDDMFLAFCLHYAGVPLEAVPHESDTQRWLDRLAQQKLVEQTEGAQPEPGDILFWKDTDSQVKSAVFCGAEPNEEADGLIYKIIGGDLENQVAKTGIRPGAVVAVCSLANAKVLYETEPAAETEPVVTDPVTESGGTETATEPTAEPSEATEPESAVDTIVQTAETENYIVTVSYPATLQLPEGTELRVVEYAKDSEIFLQRCEEAGCELAWLLNIGFYLGEEELTLNGTFDVVVTSKQGQAMGQEITHFADSGAERINGSAEDENVSFSADGFSDFGGIALLSESTVLANSYSFVTVNPAQLQEGVDYVIYHFVNDRVSFLTGDLKAKTLSTGYWYSPQANGGSWNLTANQVGSTDAYSIAWRVVKSGSQYYLVSQKTDQQLLINNGSLAFSDGGEALTIRTSGSGARISDGTNGLRYNNGWTGTNESGSYSTVYFSRITPNGRNFPHAVHTGEVNINRLRFFNICENGDRGVSALAGCRFEITNDSGYKEIVISGNSPEVSLPAGIPDGIYTITEVSAPEGYIRDTEHTRTFEVKNGALVSDNTIGTFINHNIEQLSAGKTAEVEDYNNRIYQILLTAESHLRMYQMDPIDLLFVVDQSNSMLFPSGLKDTGKTVTLRRDGRNNANNLDALNLDKSKVYYVIADPEKTSTVWAVWHDGSAWLCQDASYYAKAKHSNEPGYQDDNEIVIFPENRSYNDQKAAEAEGTRSNGCGIGYDLIGGSLGNYINNQGGSLRFNIYEATDEYNRLHYLEEALVNLIYELADVNDENRVTLTRFSRTVDEEHCIGPDRLTPDNVEKLANAVTSIKTSGGTRQDRALEHILDEHLNDPRDEYKDFDHSYTLLITDGAPVRSGSDTPSEVGTADDPANMNGNTIYSRIKGFAREITGYTEPNGTVHPAKSHLMTVALGMESVEAGKQVLEEIASDGSFYCALDDAADLVESVQKLLFESFRPKDEIITSGDVVDEISDSFYPIAWVEKGSGESTGRRVLTSDSTRDWVLLQAGDRITLDGKYSTDADAPGLLQRREDGTFYIQWKNQMLTGGWDGTFYVKAKEDFIGGNAIDTNKSAKITSHGAEVDLETPTVNVRLLDMNQMHSEVTVYLGDQVNGEGDSPLDSLKYFYEHTRFTKLVSGAGDVLNRLASADGLEEAAFYLRYAIGRDLTDEEWTRLANGDAITVPYTYDDSSHGPVGEFTFRLEKSGLGSSYHQHEAISACQPDGQPLTENCQDPAEVYTLHVTYTAYRLGQQGRPAANVHNGGSSAGPGREVGTGTTIPTGLGTVEKHNIHEVHVISGKIVITKVFDEGITDENDRTFTFTLHRMEDGEDTSQDVTKTITIPANGSQGSAAITFDGLKRGTYTVTEAEDADYAVKFITVTSDTNCYSEPPIGSSGTTLLCIMGNNVSDQNVIGKAADTDRYTSYIDPVNGVYCEAVFTNAPIVYTGDIPVEKIWDDDMSLHEQDDVYLILYLNDNPVLDADGNARILRVNAASDWKGMFTVVLKDEFDSVDHYNYSVREASEVKTEQMVDWHTAVLENDGTTVLYYDRALESGRLFAVNGKSYVVRYGVGEEGQHLVTNSRAAELPSTGGMGTHMYTFSGLLAIAAALMYGCSLWRRRERRGNQ